MKQILFLFFPILLWGIVPLSAQTIKQADYICTSENLIISIKEGNQFILKKRFSSSEAYSGTYHMENDLFVFDLGSGRFSTICKAVDSLQQKIEIEIDESYRLSSMLNHIFIGTQNKGAKEPTFKSLKEYGSTKFSVDPFEKLTLVFEDQHNENQADIFSYTLPANTSSLFVSINYDNSSDNQIYGKFDSQTQKLTLWPKDRLEDQVEFEKSDPFNEKVLTPEMTTTASFTFPGKKVVADEEDNSDFLFAERYGEEWKKVELTVESSYESALKNIKLQKNKYLVVYYYHSKNDSTFFKEALHSIKSDLYSQSDSIRKLFSFYLLKDKENKLLKQYYITDIPCFLIINTKGELVGYKKISTSSYDAFYSSYVEAFFRYLKKQDSKQESLAVLSNTKASVQQIQSALIALSRTGNKPMVKESTSFSDVVEVVDDYSDYEYYFSDFRLINTHLLDLDKEVFVKNYNRVIEAHTKDSKLDFDYVELIINELSNKKITEILSELEIEYNPPYSMILDYILTHLKSIENEGKDRNIDVPGVVSGIYENLFNQILYSDYQNGMKTYEAAKTFQAVADIVKDPYGMLLYCNIRIGINSNGLEDMKLGLDSNALRYLSHVYTTYLNPKNDIFNSLNQIYEGRLFSNGYFSESWSNLKTLVGDVLNNFAWNVVEEHQHRMYLQNALQWSETSLKIDPENHYKLDTYAHLLFLTGNKGKAIETEKKALVILEKLMEKDASDYNSYSFQRDSYQSVLEKMQNNTID